MEQAQAEKTANDFGKWFLKVTAVKVVLVVVIMLIARAARKQPTKIAN